ncbi:hypothetical protein [Fusibacter bizertensis]
MNKSKIRIVVFSLFISIMIIIMIIIFFAFKPRSIHIDKEVNVYMSGEPNFIETMRLNIEGEFDKNIFKEDSFYGDIRIEGLIDPKGELLNIIFYNGVGDLVYFNSSYFFSEFEHLGLIVIDRDFNEFCIVVYETNENASQSISHKPYKLISYPNENREESIKRFNKLKMKDDWLSYFKVE